MNIFYSWQTDTPNGIGKAFIRLALDRAVEILAEKMELCDADRPTVDQDTQGRLGAPLIAETIFEKIRESQVVVLDVTLTGGTPEGKRLINSNVAYELGYAHGYHGDSVLLKVMNTNYGTPADLPFDLQHRRWPVQFSLAPDANNTDRRIVREALAQELTEILQRYAEHGPPPEVYEPISTTEHSAAYWEPGEFLVDLNGEDNEPLQLGWNEGQPLCYLRVWPEQTLPEMSGRELADFQNSWVRPLLDRGGGNAYCRNRHGAIIYSGEGAGYLMSASQLFKNREIWGTEGFILRTKEEYERNFIPTGAFEKGMIRSVTTYLQTAFEQFGYGDRANVEAGLANVKGFGLAMPRNEIIGPVFEDVVKANGVVEREDPSTWNDFLLRLFEAVFDSAGLARPENLHDFPPREYLA